MLTPFTLFSHPLDILDILILSNLMWHKLTVEKKSLPLLKLFLTHVPR